MFYAVAKGRDIGVFDSWDKCNKLVNKFSNADYRKFKLEDEAIIYVHDKNPGFMKEYVAKITGESFKDDILYAFIDGSYNKETKKIGYGIVYVKKNEIISKDLGLVDKNIQYKSKNVLGELKSAEKVIYTAIANNYKHICICYDFEGIKGWALDIWKSNIELTQNYKKLMKKYIPILDITFKKVDTHINKYNKMADKLANTACNL